jgi:hypothetical protein
VLIRIFESKMNEVIGGLIKLNTEELSWWVWWVGHLAQREEERGVYRLLEGKRPLGRLRYRWVDNI